MEGYQLFVIGNLILIKYVISNHFLSHQNQEWIALYYFYQKKFCQIKDPSSLEKLHEFF